MKQEDRDKIGSKKAKDEMAERRRMAKEDESKIIKKAAKKFNRMYDAATNWAPYNWVLTTVSFKDVKNTAEGMRLMYEYLWGYFKTYDLTVQQLRNFILESNIAIDDPAIKEIMEMNMPLDMCESALKEITQAARDRSRANKYGIKTKKKTMVTGNAKL